MRFLFFLLVFLFSISIQAQYTSTPNNAKAGEIYINCEVEGKGVLWFKVIKNPSRIVIKKLQMQLARLEYNVVETGVLDTQTKLVLKQFNSKNNFGNHGELLYENKKLINLLYRKKRKSEKNK